jgi:hypothetical protein
MNNVNETSGKELVEITDLKSLSVYAKYHLKYLNFEFKEIKTDKVFTKGEFWDKFNKIALSLPGNINAEMATPNGFLLVDCTYRFKK